MRQPVEQAACGPYTVFALRPDTLFELADGSLELSAEASYRVRLQAGAERDVLHGALEMLGDADEGLLRFGNFFGQAELGRRTLAVRSNRLRSGQVEAMLDDIEERVAALPFAYATPVLAAYRRDEVRGPNVLYHAFAHLRDGMRGVGKHDLPAAVERILAQPHEQLNRGVPVERPIGTVDSLDPDVFLGILTQPERLQAVDPSTRLAAGAAAQRLGGRLPDVVDVSPVATSYDSVANRFVLAALDTALDVARRFIAAARVKRTPAMTVNIREAQAYTRRLERWRRHRIFDALTPATAFPLESTVLRGRPGYRQLTRWYIDLLARSRQDVQPGIAQLLELRDAAEIYEHWCFYQVVDATTRTLRRRPTLRPLPADEWGVTVPWGTALTSAMFRSSPIGAIADRSSPRLSLGPTPIRFVCGRTLPCAHPGVFTYSMPSSSGRSPVRSEPKTTTRPTCSQRRSRKPICTRCTPTETRSARRAFGSCTPAIVARLTSFPTPGRWPGRAIGLKGWGHSRSCRETDTTTLRSW
jgi:uncharacterized protein DUF2357